jgi:hypothetical protein
VAERESPKVSFPAFFFMWAEVQRWTVPDIHWRAVHWLENRSRLAVLRCFRGFGKSSLLAIYNAWRYYCNPAFRILHQGDQDKTANKTSRDTLAILKRHPLTADAYRYGVRGNANSFWWGPGSTDERNPSMQAAGILTSITSSRCDEVQNDDVEVPKNITNPENREKMRSRLGEQAHCMVPGAPILYIGTPHTHDSLYDEKEAMGADCLTIKMFEREHRIERADKGTYFLPFAPEFVLSGIGKSARALRPGRDYTLKGLTMTLKAPSGALIDCYSGSAWPERFTLDEMEFRRQQTKTINEWDSQYQLHSKPTHDVRLNPDRMIPYDVEPTWRTANGELVMMLGGVRIVGATCRWDPSSGKLKSDVSAVAITLQDDGGRRYLHRIARLTGDVVEFADDGKTITGGQVFQLCDLVQELRLPRVTIETNGIGKFSPAVLKGALKQRRLICGVGEEISAANKNKRILEALEPLLMSDDQFWAHVSVLEGPLPAQMRDWNPAVKDQPDDYIDAAAGSVAEAPERIGRAITPPDVGGIPPNSEDYSWRPSSGVYPVELEQGIVD